MQGGIGFFRPPGKANWYHYSTVIMRIIFLGIFVLSIACHAYAGGVTIVTHGWNPSLAGMPVWLESIRNAIADNHLGAEKNYGKITVTKSGSNLVATCDPWNIDLNSGASGEILIILDWSTVANHLTGGPPIQDIAAVVVEKIVKRQNGKISLAELPIHLIGHSRGGAMICEIARLLGEQGILVDHLTPLDPHPLTLRDSQPLFNPVVDTPAAIYENVLFADVYWQNTEYPTGESIAGAYNRTWGTMSGGYHDSASIYPNHRNIYLMYQGSIDLRNPLDNGEESMDSPERSAWFTTEEVKGDKSGFAFSRVKGTLARKESGLHNHQLFGGTGIRRALDWKEAVWPNIADLQIRKDGSVLGHGCYPVSIGTTLDLRYVALDYDSGGTVTIHVDSDRNPYNGNDLATVSNLSQYIPGGNNFVEKTLSWDTSGVNFIDKANIYASMSDGSRTRYFYAPACLDFSGNASYLSSILSLLLK